MDINETKQIIGDTNPWKGLNFYKEGEILYGRDDEIQSLALYVTNNIQTVLYGKSGIGKSSIINAGVFPIARREGLFPISIRLKHDRDTLYINQIKAAFKESGIGIKEILPAINEQKETLWEFFHRHTFFTAKGGVRPLIVFDQFEEFFTLQHDENKKSAFFSELADLLNEVTPQYIIDVNLNTSKNSGKREQSKDTGFILDLGANEKEENEEYISDSLFNMVFTIREDFLSYFERYTKYIPVMKTNRYALLPLNEEQAKDIIMKPLPGLVSIDVAKLIIQKVTGRTDFSLGDAPEIDVDAAVLSLYLSRLYIKKGDNKTSITADLVRQFSDDIIKDFYEESVADIPSAVIEEIEDQLLTYDGRRNNVSRNDLIREGVPAILIKTLVEERKLLRQFSYQNDIRVEFMHDILCPVVNDRMEQREVARLQAEENAKVERERQELLQQQKEELERIEHKNYLQRKTIRMRFGVVLSLLLFGVISGLASYFFYWMEYKESYANFTIKDGWPVGIGKKLNDSQKRQMPVYYQLVRRGWNSPSTRVNVLNSQKKLSQNILKESPLVSLFESEGTDEKAKYFASLQRQTSYWIYIPDNEGNVSRKIAYDMYGNELYAVQFFRSSAISESDGSGDARQKQLWANYVDKEGKSMRIRDNGADRIRILVNDFTGYHIGNQFYSETGTPQSNLYGVYGYRYQLAEDGRIVAKRPVDAFGDKINDSINHEIIYEDFDDYGRWIKASGGRAEYRKDLIVFSFQNRIDTLNFDDSGSFNYHSTKADSYYRIFCYRNDSLVETRHYQMIGNNTVLTYKKWLSNINNINCTNEFFHDSDIHYRIKQEENRNNITSVCYFGKMNERDIDRPMMISSPEGQFHKMTVKTEKVNDFTKVIKEYFDTENKLSAYCEVNRDIAFYNSNNERIKHIQYKNDSIITSYLYEYENGLVVAQSVIDENGTSIRYPQWDINHYCYYKMRLVYDFSNTIVAYKGVNEFGEESIISKGRKARFRKSEPMSQMKEYKDHELTYGLKWYKEYSKTIDSTQVVEYIHILDKKGTWYKAGIRSGDILVDGEKSITVARANVANNTYDCFVFKPSKGNCQAEHYPVYFTKDEMKRYINAINQQQ